MEELLKELKESREKLIHQDQAAKAALQQMQRETTFRIEQVWLGSNYPENVPVSQLGSPWTGPLFSISDLYMVYAKVHLDLYELILTILYNIKAISRALLYERKCLIL